MTAFALKALLDKIDIAARDVLFAIVITWLKENTLTHRLLAASVSGIFVEVEKNSFARRLPNLLPLFSQQLDPTRFVQGEDSEDGELDHCLFNLLTAFSKIIINTNILEGSEFTDDMNQIWDHVREHLLYPHAWCRLTACQLFGHLFSAHSPQNIKQLMDDDNSHEYLVVDTWNKIRNLESSFITQLQSDHLTEELVNQVVKNTLYIIKLLKVILPQLEDSTTSCDAGEECKQEVSINWLIKRMLREANYEAIKNAKITLKRNSIFKWVAAVCLELDSTAVQDILPNILATLHREINSPGSTLKELTQEIMAVLRKIVGVETFSQIYKAVQDSRAERRGVKRQIRQIEAVVQPAITAKRKLGMHKGKEDSRKRGLPGKRGISKTTKKRKLLKHMAVLTG